MAVGYALGFLTAPRSGKRTRNKLKDSKDPVADIEKDLKDIYTDTKTALIKLTKDKPELTANLIKLKDKATASQGRVKELLSAIHGHDDVDGDLDLALKDAKESLSALKRYLSE